MQPVIAVPEPLTEAERERYQRTMAIDGFGEEAQGRLKAATVCCIGAGGLGGPVLQYLAASEVGVLGPMTGWVGSVMATEVIKLLTGMGEPLLGRVMYIDTLRARVVELPLAGRS